MKNKCIRCTKKEHFGRVFESVEHDGNEFHLCVECAQIIYKAADAKKKSDMQKATALYDDFKKGITSGTESVILLRWVSTLTENME